MTEDIASIDIERTTTLLHTVFQKRCYETPSYIEWQYQRNPEGSEIASSVDIGHVRVAHYSLIPQTYSKDASECRFALSLNTAVHPSHRGKQYFAQLAKRAFDVAKRQRGVCAIIGVANANSTLLFVRKLKFIFIGPLPVRLGIAFLPIVTRTKSIKLSDKVLRSKETRTLLGAIDFSARGAWAQKWWLEKLLWRLASPCSQYHLHSHPTGLMVTCLERYGFIPVVIVLKIFRTKSAPAPSMSSLLRRACWHHKTPFYLYAGFRADAQVRGVSLPRRLLPSPLNLIYCPLSKPAPTGDELRLMEFEFLDFDAY